MRLIEVSENPGLRFSKATHVGKLFVARLLLDNVLQLMEGRPDINNPELWEHVSLVFQQEPVTKVLQFNNTVEPGRWTTSICWGPDDNIGIWQPTLLVVGINNGTRFVVGQNDPRFGEDILVLNL
jgi:hypothetical protein